MLTPSKITDTPSRPALDLPPRHDEGSQLIHDELIQGVFEPPSGFALTAIARNKLIVIALAAICALAGVWFGHSRPATYTAAATLQIGQVNPNSPGFFGYVQSATSLANAFSRSIEAEPVLATIHHKLKLAPAAAIARLSAEPIPLSPVFRVVATGGTQNGAIQLANVAAGAVVVYESKSNSANPEAASLLHEYREASLNLRRISQRLAKLPRSKSAASFEEFARIEAERSEAAVKLKAVGNSYTAAVVSQAPRSGLVSLLAGAASTTDNRKSKLELYGFVGLLAGVVLGCVAAILRERLRLARRRRAERKAGMPRSEAA